MNVTTAVILAGGFGTRMLPVTAAVQKELLPILNRPVIDYVVADCAAAGIHRILFVIWPGSHSLQDYYRRNDQLEHHLRRQHKTAALKQLDAVHHQAQFEFIEQSAVDYGTAVPVLAAIPHLPTNEAFLVCGGDDFVWHTDGRSETAALIRTFQETQAAGALMALERPASELHRYGVLQIRPEQGSKQGREYLRHLVEKPAPGRAPSNLINISKYILTPQLIPYIKAVQPHPQSGEFYLTDALEAAAQDHTLIVHRAKGEFLDAGTVTSWLHANVTIASTQSQGTPKTA